MAGYRIDMDQVAANAGCGKLRHSLSSDLPAMRKHVPVLASVAVWLAFLAGC